MSTCTRRESGRAGERGAALLVTLLSIALLTVLVVEFTYSSQVDYRRASHWLKARRAALLAESGVTLATELLLLDGSLSTSDSLAEIWAQPFPPIVSDAGAIFVRIEDLSGRFDLNLLESGAGLGRTALRRFQTILDSRGIAPDKAGALVDWIDRNRNVNVAPEGAEDFYYGTLTPPYLPRNGPLRSFSELALVRGFGPEELVALREVAAVLGGEEAAVNINTAPAAVLRTLDPRLEDERLVAALVARRDLAPFLSHDEIAEVEGMGAFGKGRLRRMFTLASSHFRIRATGEVDGIYQSIEAVVHRRHGSEIEIQYWLPRRGPNIAGVDLSTRLDLSDAGLFEQMR